MHLSLAGCTGMDVVSILKKMRAKVDNFSIEVESESREEHPKVYNTIHLTYIFRGKGLDMKKIKKVATLSQEKYCAVNAMFKQAIEISYDIEIKE